MKVKKKINKKNIIIKDIKNKLNIKNRENNKNRAEKIKVGRGQPLIWHATSNATPKRFTSVHFEGAKTFLFPVNNTMTNLSNKRRQKYLRKQA